jgi:hypothetical protein
VAEEAGEVICSCGFDATDMIIAGAAGAVLGIFLVTFLWLKATKA